MKRMTGRTAQEVRIAKSDGKEGVSGVLGRAVEFVPLGMVIAFLFFSLTRAPILTIIGTFTLYVFGAFERGEKTQVTKDHESMEKALGILDAVESRLLDGEDAKAELVRLRNTLKERCTETSLRISSSSLNLVTAGRDQPIKVAVLKSKVVREALAATRQDEKAAEKIYDRMAAKQSSSMLRFLVVIFKRAMGLLFPLGIRIDEGEVDRIRKIAEDTQYPLVLLPNHKSHMDYLTIHYLCATHQIPIPHVVSGDNLNMAVIGPLLQAVGAFFIRRTFAGDQLYGAIFKTYVKELLRHGLTLECYIEGGRSRSGKLLPPKVGFLRCVVDAIMEEEVEDAWVVPISLSYDRIVENDSHIAELQGGMKRTERLGSTFRNAWHLLANSYKKALCFGRVDVAFGAPISVRKFLQAKEGEEDWAAKPPNHLTLATSLGYKVLYECNEAQTILPTALVGTVMLMHEERGLREEALLDRVEWLSRQVTLRGGHVVQEASLHDSVHYVVEQIMGSRGKTRLVKKHKQLLMTGLFSPSERMELSTFRNQLIHLFVLEGFVASSAHQIIRRNLGTVTQAFQLQSNFNADAFPIARSELLKACGYLSALLKLEFIFKPSAGGNRTSLVENFDETMGLLQQRGVIMPKATGEGENQRYYLATQDTLLFNFLTALIHPFVDSYYLAALSLLELLPDVVRSQSLLLSSAQTLGEKMYFEGSLDYYESLSKETLTNAMNLFVEMKVIEPLNVQGVRDQTFKLTEKYRERDALLVFIHEINGYRHRPSLSPEQSAREAGIEQH